MLSDSPGLCGALHVGSTVVGMDDRGWRGQSRCHRVRARKGRLVQTHEVGRRSTSHFCANPHLLAPQRPERGGWHKHTRLAGRIPLPPTPRVPEKGGWSRRTTLAAGQPPISAPTPTSWHHTAQKGEVGTNTRGLQAGYRSHRFPASQKGEVGPNTRGWPPVNLPFLRQPPPFGTAAQNGEVGTNTRGWQAETAAEGTRASTQRHRRNERTNHSRPLGPCSRCVIARSKQRPHRSSGSAPRLSTRCCRAGTA